MPTSAGMDLKHWQKALRKASGSSTPATRLSDVNAAAKNLMRAKEALKRLKGAQTAG